MANSLEMLSGRRKKDYATESAAQAFAAQAEAMGFAPIGAGHATDTEADADDDAAAVGEPTETEEEALVAA